MACRDFFVTKELDEFRDLVTFVQPTTQASGRACVRTVCPVRRRLNHVGRTLRGVTHSASSPGRSKRLRLPAAQRHTWEEAVAAGRTAPGHPGQSGHCDTHTRSPSHRADTVQCNLRECIWR